MLKLPTLVARLQASPAVAQRSLPITLSAIQKFSQSQTTLKIYNINNHNEFDQKIINSNVPVIVNFHADWCAPCKTLTPMLTTRLENADDIDLAVIDVDKNIDLVETFDVRAVPAILVFRNGIVTDKLVGLMDDGNIEEFIEKIRTKARLQKETEREEATKKSK
ncbi:thioredoxin, mitochondrial [Glossina fuscipes]|uniref:Thioredoxin, mitochondrial n=2 Tax=Nemorhina TaxID=44051 RepID=A0A9C5Z495_9MUSC|nr:thioredoxin, mitochondrial [Glossina fuscipes]